MGESFGLFRYGADEELLPFLSSANIACGFHAGDPSVMRRTVALAARHGVAIGAHVGFPDLLGFGRRRLQASPAQVQDYVTYQIGALQGFVGAAATMRRPLEDRLYCNAYIFRLGRREASRACEACQERS